MPRFLPDSSCIVAAVLSWHDHHDAAFGEIERRLEAGEEMVVELLRDSAAGGVAGGQAYDAIIAACARAARVDSLLTFNARHFQRLAQQGIAVTVPGSEAPGS